MQWLEQQTELIEKRELLGPVQSERVSKEPGTGLNVQDSCGWRCWEGQAFYPVFSAMDGCGREFPPKEACERNDQENQQEAEDSVLKVIGRVYTSFSRQEDGTGGLQAIDEPR